MTRRQQGLDLFDLLEAEEQEAKLATAAPCLYHSPTRGIPARQAELAAWVEAHGKRRDSHAWTLSRCNPEDPTDVCRPTVLDVDVRAEPLWRPSVPLDCDCLTTVNDLMFRGACLHCDWEGPPRPDENWAVEDAHDHTWPGWRALPIVAQAPHDVDGRGKKHATWEAKVRSLYPDGWLDAGGPVRTWRDRGANRHVDGRAPGGGYDLGVVTHPTHLFTATSKTGKPTTVLGVTAGETVGIWGDNDLRWRLARCEKDPDLEVTVIDLAAP